MEKSNAVEKLELAEMIKGLRAQLTEAQKDGEGENVRFTVEDVELELEIAAEGKVEGGVSAKFYVLTSHFKAEKKDSAKHKLKLKLKPTLSPREEESAEESAGQPLSISGIE